ncbi:MAG TPA: hypothetical protein VFC58_15000 [Desulfosporosinus sp.]|nr:hypothetical protein [Desulfosporosinus sp.]
MSSVLTVGIIIWAIYRLFTAATKKKGTQQIPGTPGGTWREQLKQALENGPYKAGSLQPDNPMEFEEIENSYVETEGTQENQETKGISEYVGLLGSEAYKSTKETLGEEIGNNPAESRCANISLTKRELVQGVMWAEILGKPRAMHPYRGPRT